MHQNKHNEKSDVQMHPLCQFEYTFYFSLRVYPIFHLAYYFWSFVQFYIVLKA